MQKLVIMIDGTARSLLTAAAALDANKDCIPVFYVTSSHVVGDNNFAHAIIEKISERFHPSVDVEVVDGTHVEFPYVDSNIDSGEAIPPFETENQYFSAARVAAYVKSHRLFVPGYDVLIDMPMGISLATIAALVQRGAHVAFAAPYMTFSEALIIRTIVDWFPDYYSLLTLCEYATEADRAKAFAEAVIPDPHELALIRAYPDVHQLPDGENYEAPLVERFTGLLPADDEEEDPQEPVH